MAVDSGGTRDRRAGVEARASLQGALQDEPIRQRDWQVAVECPYR